MLKFGSIDALINNAGIFITEPFVDYTDDDFKRVSATNLDGFIHLTQLVVRQMLGQNAGGSLVSITTSLVNHPIAGFNASVTMVTRSLRLRSSLDLVEGLGPDNSHRMDSNFAPP